jgi:hypothetical protein
MSIRFLIVVSIFFSSICVSAQFAPIGTVWHYNIGLNHLYNGFTKKESIKDTLILGVQVKKICSDPCSYPVYVAQTNDTVFVYREDKNEFVKLFYYGGKIGDTLYLDVPQKGLGNDSSHYKVVLTKVFNTIIDGKSYKTYRHIHNDIALGRTFIEGVGFTARFFPLWGSITLNTHPGLRCFNGNIVDQQFKDIACDAHGLSVDELSSNNKQALLAFPNPASNSVTIGSKKLGSVSQLKMVSASGVTVFENKHPSFPLEINTANFPVGIYFVLISTKNNESISQKIVLK